MMGDMGNRIFLFTKSRGSSHPGIADSIGKINDQPVITSPENSSRIDRRRPTASQSSLIVQNGVDDNCASLSSGVVPTLSPPSSSAASISLSESVSTSAGDRLPLEHILDNDRNGNLIAPTGASSTGREHNCFFHILDCNKTFVDHNEWKIHVLSHFRTSSPPTIAQCPACSYSTSDPRHSVAWRTMLTHLAGEHLKHGYPIHNSNPSFATMRHMYCSGVIEKEDLCLLQLVAAPGRPGYDSSMDSVRANIGSSDDAYLIYANPRRERRIRGRRPPRVIVV
ncbi:hypothetical protein ACO22_06477 [Paracoccidioides brasiliensis]|nr:hypothetical protein ACO22_06477 [Paracoccidioides brasiliensis]